MSRPEWTIPILATQPEWRETQERWCHTCVRRTEHRIGEYDDSVLRVCTACRRITVIRRQQG